jgi:thiamine biosynthesis lipoprotein
VISVAFRAMGTSWWVTCDRHNLLVSVEAWVRSLEARLTRFEPTSSLSRLNRERSMRDPLLAAVARAALRWQAITKGAFDPTLGRPLAALGYDRDFGTLVPVPLQPGASGSLRVNVDASTVSLEGEGTLDLGGIAKGWAVDRVHDRLRRRGARAILVDGGGDLRGSGRSWPLGVPGDRAIVLNDGAVATSSTLERRWTATDGTPLHHILDPATRMPADSGIVTATVRAPDATTADVLATALVVGPATVVPLLADHGASALLVDRSGRAWGTHTWTEAS